MLAEDYPVAISGSSECLVFLSGLFGAGGEAASVPEQLESVTLSHKGLLVMFLTILAHSQKVPAGSKDELHKAWEHQ